VIYNFFLLGYFI